MAPRLLRQEEAAKFVASITLLRLFHAAKWGAPTVDRNRMVLWDVNTLNHCVDRLAKEGYDALEQDVIASNSPADAEAILRKNRNADASA